MPQQVWLITGTSSGFGLELALAVAATGAATIGTVRSRSKSADAVEKLENAGVRVLVLDASLDALTVKGVAQQAESIHGRVDVLVNNAGFSVIGAVEDFRYVLLDHANEHSYVCSGKEPKRSWLKLL